VESSRLSRLGHGALSLIMKVAFLNDHIYGYAISDAGTVGGSERQQWLLARSLALSGWSVCVGIRAGLNAGEKRTIDGVEFWGIKKGHYLLDWNRFFSSASPDWLYWRGATHLLGPLVQIAHFHRVKVAFAVAFDTDVHPRSALASRQRWWPLYLWGLSQAELLFLQHGGQLEGLPSWWRAKAVLVRSIAEVNHIAKPHASRERCVAWVGMLRQPKRPDLLIEIAKRTPDIKYVVCGGVTKHRSPVRYSQQMIDEFRKMPNVIFHGQVSPEEAERVIGEAALLLCTSDQEGFPNVFLQAWSSGTPVISLQIDPDSNIQKLGLGMVSSTLEGAIKDIHNLIDSYYQRDEIAVRAKRYIAKNHSQAAVVGAFECALMERQFS
jgi:glycosyltransferase involved in cell wall biosynthesis